MFSPVTTKAKNTGLTHRQIAEELGVSRQLVGFALRGEGRMSDEVRQRILEVARRDGYDQFSNGAARSMAARRHGKKVTTGLMAVLFTPTFEGQPLSSVPFFMPFFEGLEGEAIERGLDLMLCPLRPQGLPRLVREAQVDGVISLLTDRVPLVLLQSLQVPVVHILLAAGKQEGIGNSPILTMDVRRGSFLATQHLIELEHKRIAYLGFSGPGGLEKAQTQHLLGFQDAMRAHDLSWEPALVNTQLPNTTVTSGICAMQQMLDGQPPRFSGVVCSNDLIAMGAVRALQEAGQSVPGAVSVVGFDDVSGHYAFQPALSSICFSRQSMGRRAVQLLSALPDQNSGVPAVNPEIFPVELVQRESTAIASRTQNP